MVTRLARGCAVSESERFQITMLLATAHKTKPANKLHNSACFRGAGWAMPVAGGFVADAVDILLELTSTARKSTATSSAC